MSEKKIAEVKTGSGRYYLSICGFAVAMEGDKCRDLFPEHVCPPIPEHELERATIGGKPAKDLPLDMIRWFRGDNWNRTMLQYVADEINKRAVER